MQSTISKYGTLYLAIRHVTQSWVKSPVWHVESLPTQCVPNQTLTGVHLTHCEQIHKQKVFWFNLPFVHWCFILQKTNNAFHQQPSPKIIFVQNTEQDKSHNGNILVLCMMNKSWVSIPNLLTSAVPLLNAQMLLYLCFLNSDCEWFWTKSLWLGKTRIWKSRISFSRLGCFLLHLDTRTCSVTVNQLISPKKCNIILEKWQPTGLWPIHVNAIHK